MSAFNTILLSIISIGCIVIIMSLLIMFGYLLLIELRLVKDPLIEPSLFVKKKKNNVK